MVCECRVCDAGPGIGVVPVVGWPRGRGWRRLRARLGRLGCCGDVVACIRGGGSEGGEPRAGAGARGALRWRGWWCARGGWSTFQRLGDVRGAGVCAGKGGRVPGCAFAVALHAGVAQARHFSVVVRVRVGCRAARAGAAFRGGAAGGAGWCFWWRGREPAVSAARGRVPRDGREQVLACGVVGVVLYQVLVVVLCLGGFSVFRFGPVVRLREW